MSRQKQAKYLRFFEISWDNRNHKLWMLTHQFISSSTSNYWSWHHASKSSWQTHRIKLKNYTWMFTLRRRRSTERVTCCRCHYRDQIYWEDHHRREKDSMKLLHLNTAKHFSNGYDLVCRNKRSWSCLDALRSNIM